MRSRNSTLGCIDRWRDRAGAVPRTRARQEWKGDEVAVEASLWSDSGTLKGGNRNRTSWLTESRVRAGSGGEV